MTICRTLALLALSCLLPIGAAIAEGIIVHDARDRDAVIDDRERHACPPSPN